MPSPDRPSRVFLDCELDGKPSRVKLAPDGPEAGFSLKVYCRPRSDEPFQHHLTIIGDYPADSFSPALTVIKENDKHPIPVMLAGFTSDGDPI